MVLHVFNPEHDLVLAAGEGNFTPPKMVRNFYADLGFLPALWAKEGDIVWVADVEAAREKLRHIKRATQHIVLMNDDMLTSFLLSNNGMEGNLTVEPWGWDRKMKCKLTTISRSSLMLPSDSWLDEVRRMSSREWMAQNFLPELKTQLIRKGLSRIVGHSFVLHSMQQLRTLLLRHPLIVVKAPWSSSGRGIRYIDRTPDPSTAGWCANIIDRQGCITAEPYYNKICDFGMEFFCHPDGTVRYLGLSIFKTSKRMYTGSLLATEADKRAIPARYVDVNALDIIADTAAQLSQQLFSGVYTGPFGIDMMVVSDADGAPAIHPCVELNLRRTMGHVALALSPDATQPQQLMSITHATGSYRLRLHTISDGWVNNELFNR